MAFADPQTLTVNAVPQTLNRIKAEGTRSEYSTADGVYKFVISHQQSGKRTRRMIRVDKKVVAADPLTATNDYKSCGIYLVIDEPEYGFTDTEIWDVIAGLKTWLDNTAVLKVLATQS
jgi:hypothetical protein